jgi:hypothetical protein
MTKEPKFVLFALIALVVVSAALPASAQSPGSATMGTSPGWGTPGHGMMMGPGMMDRSEFDRVCHPGAAGFAEWRIDLLDESLKQTAAQRVKFEEFRSMSSNAGDATISLSMQRLAPVGRLFSIPGKDAVVSGAGMIPCRSAVSGICPRAAAQAWV